MRVDGHVPDRIDSIKDAQALVDWCINEIGLGYHPDEPAAAYATEDGTPVFTDEAVAILDRLHDEAFAAGHGEAMYTQGLSRFHKMVTA